MLTIIGPTVITLWVARYDVVLVADAKAPARDEQRRSR